MYEAGQQIRFVPILFPRLISRPPGRVFIVMKHDSPQAQPCRLERRRARLRDRQDQLYRLLIGSRGAVLPAKRLASFMAVSQELTEVEHQLAQLEAQRLSEEASS